MSNKVIISCAITGAMHTPTMSDHLPISPESIAEELVAAAEAGAAIIHLHARVPETGEPTGDPDIFARFLPVIKQQSDAIVNITTGGSPAMTVQDRLRAAIRFKPEMCSLNMGTMNFAIFPAANRISKWKYSWEEDYVVNSDDFIFRNTFRDIAYILESLGEAGTKFEHECYDVGHLYNLAHFLDRGLVKPPFFVQMIFGILGGIGADLDNLMFMKQTADRLFGKGSYQWSVLAAGRHQMPFVTQAALLGGNVRVGLEDSLFLGRGQMATSNAQQVAKIRRILGEMGLEPASPAEAREMLGLKGGDRVGFSTGRGERFPRGYEMPMLSVVDRSGAERMVTAASGSSVMEAIRDNGFDELLALCGGCRSCATCHVFVDPAWFAAVGVPAADESDLLDSSDSRNEYSRLSCQIELSDALDGLRVTIAPED